VEKLFGIWFAASAKATGLQNVLMDKRHFSAASIKICYDLTAGTMWVPGPSSAWGTFSNDFLMQVTRIDFTPVAALVKQLAYLRGGDELDQFTTHV
jgi:hypothetical protein